MKIGLCFSIEFIVHTIIGNPIQCNVDPNRDLYIEFGMQGKD